MKNYKEFLNEKKDLDVLRYYLFDWDDNILKMHTLLHFWKKENGELIPTDITPEEFAEMRDKDLTGYLDNEQWLGDPDKTFTELRHFGPRGGKAFIEYVKTSIDMGNYGPSWDVFLNTLKNGYLFSIITTRGHEPNTLRNAVEYIILNILTEADRSEMYENLKDFNIEFGENVKDEDLIEHYLDKCYFIGLFSKAFEEQFNFIPQGKLLNKGKKEAIKYFVDYARDFAKNKKLPLKIGFSDDDIRFTGAAKELFMGMEKSLDFMEDFYVFDTSDPKIKGGIKTKI